MRTSELAAALGVGINRALRFAAKRSWQSKLEAHPNPKGWATTQRDWEVPPAEIEAARVEIAAIDARLAARLARKGTGGKKSRPVRPVKAPLDPVSEAVAAETGGRPPAPEDLPQPTATVKVGPRPSQVDRVVEPASRSPAWPWLAGGLFLAAAIYAGSAFIRRPVSPPPMPPPLPAGDAPRPGPRVAAWRGLQ